MSPLHEEPVSAESEEKKSADRSGVNAVVRSQDTADIGTRLEVARQLDSAGLNVVAIRADGSKAAAGRWKESQTARTDPALFPSLFESRSALGLGIVTGVISGGVEMLELEGRAMDRLHVLVDAINDAGLGHVWRPMWSGLREESPNRGVHVFVRIIEGAVRGNLTLAYEADPERRHGAHGEKLAETRGEGGIVVMAPSGGAVHPSGRSWTRVAGAPTTIPKITAEDRDALYEVIRATLDESGIVRPVTGGPATFGGSGTISRAAALALIPDGPLDPAYESVLDLVSSTGTGHDDMVGATSALAKVAVLGRKSGGRAAYEQMRATYVGTPDPSWSKSAEQYGREFDSAFLGSVALRARQRVEQDEAQALDREMHAMVSEPPPPARDRTRVPPVHALAAWDETARRWLGPTYDLESGHAVLAAAACERLGGDPVWLLTVSGSGNAKTETLSALTGAGATVVSTIASEGALLSGTSTKDRSKTATGGLLRQVGASGVVAIKDVTSILSMNRDARAAVLAALREVYDGRWIRTLGTEGGKTLTWEGRLVVVGAVTSAWDKAHAVISTMGDRFVLIRPSSREGRMEAGRQAIRNTDHEVEMRAELAVATGDLLDSVDPGGAYELSELEIDRLLAAADLVTLARTAVDVDYQGNPVDANEPEMPTRFAKQLQQVFRGGLAIGLARDTAFALALRCARDSVPPLRLDLLEDVAANADTIVPEVVRRLQKPRTTIDRGLQSLQLLGLLEQGSRVGAVGAEGKGSWTYRLRKGVDPDVLRK